MLQSHFYPFHIQDQAPKYSFCSCLTTHTHPHSVLLKTNSDNDTWTVHSWLAYQILYAAQHTRWHQVKPSEVPIWVPPSPSPVSWSSGCQSQEGLGVRCLIMEKAAMVGPADGEGDGVTSSQSEWHPRPPTYGLYPLFEDCVSQRDPTPERCMEGKKEQLV